MHGIQRACATAAGACLPRIRGLPFSLRRRVATPVLVSSLAISLGGWVQGGTEVPGVSPPTADTVHDDTLARALEEIHGGLTATGTEAVTRFRTAEGHARSSVERDPGGAEGHHLLAVALGLLAERTDGREAVALAAEAFASASRALELDPDHAGAHHVLGRVHAAVMRLGRVRRFLAVRLLGGEGLAGASWQEAERHLSFAASRAPGVADHHWELAALYRDTGRPFLAYHEALHVLSLEPRPWEEGTREKAQALVALLPPIPEGSTPPGHSGS
jgi:hypothetical protein